MIYIIAYDIADNKRRLRVAKTLESWGYRIQESVFQLRLDTATLARVRSSLAALISESDDVIHIYPSCSSCADRADMLGAAIALDDVGLCRGVWWGLVASNPTETGPWPGCRCLRLTGRRCILRSVARGCLSCGCMSRSCGLSGRGSGIVVFFER